MTITQSVESFLSAQENAQDWEAAWWGDCRNTFGEEAKQLTYAHKMGLINQSRDGKWPVYDLAGQSVIDIGGGPVSMLLKTVNGDALTVVDPCPYPDWITARYEAAGIFYYRWDAETWRPRLQTPSMQMTWDEAWIYNVLQHVIDPEAVIATARLHAKAVRVFEWVEMDTNVGHPHSLRVGDLDAWLGGHGATGYVDENGAVGQGYWGAFA